jgi:beta-N-acetylhexosaminidase
MALGSAADAELTRRVYRALGSELADIGVNLDFAPVADLNSNARNPVIGLRSFGDDPSTVAEQVRAAVLGLHEAGIGATAKHFPGHGDTTVDSHEALPSVQSDRAQLLSREFVPFRAAIDANVDVMMTAHVLLPALTGDKLPATLSRFVLEDILRKELGFQGVICTDDMQMRAIADAYGPGEAAVRALQAGADLVLFSSFKAALVAEKTLAEAVGDGRLDVSRVEASLKRIESLRNRLAQRTTASPIDRAANTALAREVARRAIALVRSATGVPPLSVPPGARILIVNFEERDAGSRGRPSSTARVSSALGKSFAAAGYHVTEQLRSVEPAGHEYKQLLMAAGSADAIVALTRRAFMHPLQARAVSDLAMLGKLVVAVAASEPYDALDLPDNVAVIASFGDDEAALEAAAQVLLGRAQAMGKLPVQIAPVAVEFTRPSRTP